MRKFKFAIAQMTSVADTNANFNLCKALIDKAAEQGAKLLALPEGFHFIGTHFTQSVQVAEPITGPTITEYRKIAKNKSIWLSLGGLSFCLEICEILLFIFLTKDFRRLDLILSMFSIVT